MRRERERLHFKAALSSILNGTEGWRNKSDSGGGGSAAASEPHGTAAISRQFREWVRRRGQRSRSQSAKLFGRGLPQYSPHASGKERRGGREGGMP